MYKCLLECLVFFKKSSEPDLEERLILTTHENSIPVLKEKIREELTAAISNRDGEAHRTVCDTDDYRVWVLKDIEFKVYLEYGDRVYSGHSSDTWMDALEGLFSNFESSVSTVNREVNV